VIPSKKLAWDHYKCKKSWEKINREMKDIGLLEFGSLEDFVDLHEIVKQHAKQDSTWTTKITMVASMAPGQVQ
jgi:hypothetical protein